MHTSLKNKITLVTGVSSGIGREIAQLLAERGARVFGTVRNPQSAKLIHGVEVVRMDVTDDASVNEAVQSIVRKAGPIQFLVNNAGYSFMGALEETSVAEARQQFETNLFGVLRVTNAILPGMRQQGDGRIVNISSVLGFLPAPYWGNLRGEQTCSRRIYRDVGSRDQEVRRARAVGRTRIYEDEIRGQHQIRKNLSRHLRG
jgi:NAD(P)-dependent dehydrogenase (short-subunit alcohol dehydrogenase family)